MGEAASRIRADFNGLFGEYLCISHSETVEIEDGRVLTLVEGVELLAYDPDEDDDGPCFLVARGRTVRTPPGACGPESRWALRIDAQGVRHVSRLDEA